MSEQQERDREEEITWGSLNATGKALVAAGMTALGLGVGAVVVLVLLLMVLIVTAAFSDLIEFDGLGTLLWAALLSIPCGLLAGVFTTPVRLLVRLSRPAERTKQAAETVTSCLTTFIAAMFVLQFTPGLHATNPWLPSAAATLLGIVANLVMDRMDRRNRVESRKR
ncbi:hypothetical protein ACFVYR_29945 [Streptomyces sp. NPDC058284]|uniref:hypothetical protein n=1 Tax=unclassified Streptomyces TaxID=2593676 RepID=UPI00366553AB